ncbi:hypothetical protein BDZ94DRAFT_1244957 [Collybia nuda]|uniref:Uncharacterized protein n=1 Tax=Collybia nuda TaxID=64659 RepID=A0A9P5YFC3_9AGAR|nr:hypothetical protein BDZ94DRAFT_1244957 [Collybia nuda]
MASRTEENQESFFFNILKPGSSLNPTFLAILDGAFAILFCVFLGLAYLTSGNPHIFALMGIELGLWASVKWFISELHKTSMVVDGGDRKEETKKDL